MIHWQYDLRLVLCLLGYKKYIPGPPTNVRSRYIVNLRAIAELITILVSMSRLLVIKAKCIDSQRGQGMELIGLRDNIMVAILPQP